MIALSNGKIYVFNLDLGKIIHIFQSELSILSFKLTPDGRTLITTNQDISGSNIVFWDFPTRKQVRSIKIPSQAEPSSFSFNSVPSFNRDGTIIAIAVSGQTVNLFDVSTGKLLKKLNSPMLGGTITLSEDGKRLASDLGGIVQIWDLISGNLIQTIYSQSDARTNIEFSPDGNVIATNSSVYVGHTINLWNIADGNLALSLRGSYYPIKSLALSPNGKFIASSGGINSSSMMVESLQIGMTITQNNFKNFNDDIRLWSFETGGVVDRFQPLLVSTDNIVFSKDSKFIRSTQKTGLPFPILIDLNSKKVSPFNELGTVLQDLITQEIKKNQPVLLPISISSDWEKIVLEDSSNHTIKIFDISSKSLLYTLKGHSSSIRAVAFSQKYNLFASSDDAQGVKIWNLADETTKQNLKGHLGKIISFEFSPDEETLAGLDENGLANLWNVTDGKRTSFFPNSNVISFSSDGNLIAVVNKKQKVNIFDVKSNSPHNSLEGHNDEITSVVFSSDKSFLFTGSKDNTIKIWDVKTGKELASLISLSEGNCLVTTPEGFFDGSPNAWKQLIWRFNNNTFDYAPVETYFNDFFYPNLLQDVLAGKSPQAKTGQELEKIDRRQPLVEITSVNGQVKQIVNQTLNDKRTVSVSVEVADNASEKKQANHNLTSGARDLRLFRNGSLVKVWRDDVFAENSGCERISKPNEPTRVRCRAEIPIVAGENNFTAYAFNSANVKSNDDAVTVKGADGLKRDGTLYVLAIGVNKYANADYNLNYAVPDVVDIGNAIKTQQAKLAQDSKLKQYSKTEIITLTDETATRDNLLLALKRFAEGDKAVIPNNASEKLKAELAKISPVQPEDAVLIYFAGHGVSSGQRFYLLLHNFTRKGEKPLAQGVSDEDLNDYLEKVDAGRLLMVIDACQSGQALGEKTEGRAPMNSKGLAQLAYDKGMLILTAAQSQQAALEVVRIGGKEVKHGLLTYALLEAMQNPQADADKDGNKQLWEREWFDFAVEQVPLLQTEAMKQRRIDLKNGVSDVKGRSDIIYLDGDDPNLDPEKRRVQTPRVFYRREPEINPLVLAKP